VTAIISEDTYGLDDARHFLKSLLFTDDMEVHAAEVMFHVLFTA
jgi:hypothetical protein